MKNRASRLRACFKGSAHRIDKTRYLPAHSLFPLHENGSNDVNDFEERGRFVPIVVVKPCQDADPPVISETHIGLACSTCEFDGLDTGPI